MPVGDHSLNTSTQNFQMRARRLNTGMCADGVGFNPPPGLRMMKEGELPNQRTDTFVELGVHRRQLEPD